MFFFIRKRRQNNTNNNNSILPKINPPLINVYANTYIPNSNNTYAPNPIAYVPNVIHMFLLLMY